MGEKRVRGAVLIGYLKFIERTWGDGGLAQCSGEVNFEMGQLRESSWYDVSYSTGILRWIGNKKGREFVERCGTSTVKELGMLSYIVAFSSVRSLLAKAPANYADVFSYGRMEVAFEERRATIRMFDAAEHEYSCLTWLGAFKGILDKTRTKGTVAETQCQRKGAPHCEYLMEWA
jgi:hypothetical protein